MNKILSVEEVPMKLSDNTIDILETREIISPTKLLKILKNKKRLILDYEIVPAKLGSDDFGEIIITYKSDNSSYNKLSNSFINEEEFITT